MERCFLFLSRFVLLGFLSVTVDNVVSSTSRGQLNRELLRCASVMVLGYSAFVGYTVALAASRLLAGSSTKLLGKRSSSGIIHPLGWLMMLPYHLGLRVKLGVQRLISSEALYNRVLPGWYIGGWPWSGSELPPDSPSVLDCTCELPRTHRNRYMCLPIWDTQAPTPALIERGVAFALTERALGKSVYVHCAHGHGRSALLLIACLLEAGHVATWEEGLAVLKAARPRVHLNSRQRQALEGWVHSRGGRDGVQMQALSSAVAGGGGGGNTPLSSAVVTMPAVVNGSMVVLRRGSAGGVSDGGSGVGGAGNTDVSARVHLLADTRDPRGSEAFAAQCGTAGTASYGGLESRLSGLAAAASGVLHSASNLPLTEPLRNGASQVSAAAAAAAAAAAVAGGKKLS
ncbi:hypothetical protein VOLCADRAFT_121563 [Volvox carteri f. nagariensis]|uniref:Tyrosine specific protein phosphatases domain-containing protein n=1 Tax=Volvox carteri f. nagariensis TaxID=3068 RepID=D8UDF9_VOLCA|nr:uncharacterized protein VOLCADRAFT_121563 [Volvox carteri f. nagariensis]EFJ42305.1 hypothetical protein VOLCADRAFT_121563 [Volvox carteri f. nagariensis]|eukprot:XP_002956703.1 hypothetical protein VOLCADRAFT_121563 [Volvox carteri f. nagariensis]